MAKDPTILQVELMFRGLNKAAAVHSFPSPGTLKNNLSSIIGDSRSGSRLVNQASLSDFATAAVEMWHRSVHSFLISAAVTKASPIWSSVTGYYSSHYSIRAFAHLLGYFYVFKKKCAVQLNGHNCQWKKENEREHIGYWKIVKNNPPFNNDPFFTFNRDITQSLGMIQSDVGHRDKANYLDHLNQFPNFEVLDETYLEKRVNKISRIAFNDPPIPIVDRYPDIDNVQLIAYHRMVRFKFYLDTILGDDNRFWSFHRRPSWSPAFLKFQVVTPMYSSVYSELNSLRT